MTYEEIGDVLKDKYKKEYFTSQEYNAEDDGFLAPVIPLEGMDKFFGPRVFTILILSRTYGWDGNDFNWPPEELQVQIDKLKEVFETWTEYLVHIYIDFNANVDSEKLEMTAAAIQEMCEELADYGLVYKGPLPESATWDVFRSDYDHFYQRD